MSKKSSNRQKLLEMSAADKREGPIQTFMKNTEGAREAVKDFMELREEGHPVTYKHLHRLLAEKYQFKWGQSSLKSHLINGRHK